MLNKILEVFFRKEKKNHLTILTNLENRIVPQRNRTIKNPERVFNQNVNNTVLSGYFKNLKGLNVKERFKV